MAVMSADQITIIDVTDAYSVMLSMDAVSLTGGEDSLGTAQTVTIYVSALMGAMKVTPRIGTIECPANVEATVGSAIDSVVPITVLFNAAVKRSGKLSIPVTVNNEVTITKEFAYSISFKGEGGTPGKDGKDGKDGFSPAVTKSGDTVTITDANGHTVTVKDGADGHSIKGDDGEDAYVHIAWANSADGSTDFSTTDSANKLYMGTYTDHTLADSTKPSDYAWVKIKGDPGVSITGVTNYYLATNASSGVTRSTSGWTTGIQAITESKQYLWNYEVTVGSDGSTISTTDPVIIGRYGKDGGSGSAGRGIAEITEYYCASASTTAPADSEFSTSVQTTNATKKYLWNYEKITYTSGNPETTAKRIIGTYGDKGDKGVSVTNVTSTNNTADGGTSVVTVTLSDGTTKTFNVKNGNKGNPGTNGASSQWYYGNKCTHTSGTAKPATGIAGAIVGDMYLNTDTYSVYRCTTAGASGTAVWTYAGNLVEGVIDGFEVGGRNLLAFSELKHPFPMNAHGLTYTQEDDGWIRVKGTATNTAAGVNPLWMNDSTTTKFGPGTYTLTLEDPDGVFESGKLSIQVFWNGTTGAKYYVGPGKKTFTENVTSYIYRIYVYYDTGAKDTVYDGRFRLKLERGNKATDWSPAPEDIDAKCLHYGTCATAIGTAAKVVALSGFALYTGAQITVKFTNGNSAAAPTLNVNSTGAKAVIVNGATSALTGKMDFPAGTTCSFTYDGSHWQLTGTDNIENVMEWTESGGLKVKAKSGSKSMVNVTASAVDIYDKNGKLGNRVNDSGMTVYKGGSKRAEFFDSVNLYASDGSTKIASFAGDGVSLHSTSLQNVGRFYVTSDTKDGKTRTFGTLSLGSSENPVIKGYNYTGSEEDISALIMGVNGTEWDSKFTASLDFTGMEFQQDNVGKWSAGLQSGGFYVGGPNGGLMDVDSSGNGAFAGGLSVNGTISCDYDQITLANTNMKKGELFLYKIGKFVVFSCIGDFVNLPTGGIHTYIPISSVPASFRPSTSFLFSCINNTAQRPVMYIHPTTGISFYNYGAAITTATNGAFGGIYVAN